MKNLSDFMAGPNYNLFLTCTFLLVAAFFLYFFSKNIVSLSKEKKLQNNPLSFGAEHINCYFKVLKINVKKGIVYLGYNPTVQHPFGVGGGWFKIDKIPDELRSEYSVIYMIKETGDQVTFIKGPIF